MKSNIQTWKIIDLTTKVTFSASKEFGVILSPEHPGNETSVELVKVTPEELGVKSKGLDFGEICQIAEKNGLKPCPQVTGLVLREIYKDQPKGEGLHVVSNPMLGRTGNEIYVVGTDASGKSFLSTEPADTDYPYMSTTQFIFQKEKSKQSASE